MNFTDELKPTYTSTATWFKAVLPNLNYQLSATVEKTVEKILVAIAENPQVSQKQLSELLGISRRGIEWNMKKLRNNGVIKRIVPIEVDIGKFLKTLLKNNSTIILSNIHICQVYHLLSRQ